MGGKVRTDYQEPRHSPRRRPGQITGWDGVKDREGYVEMPRSFGRILVNLADRQITRIQSNSKEFVLGSLYKLKRQYEKIIQKQVVRKKTLEAAQRDMRRLRTQLIRMVGNTPSEQIEGWKATIEKILISIEKMQHESVEQIRARLRDMYGSVAFEDSAGRPKQSGPAQAQLQASDRRADEAIEDALEVKLGIMYYLALVQEAIDEIETQLRFMEEDLVALHEQSFETNRYAEMREGEATRYAANNILETINEFMWGFPFSEYSMELRKLAEEVVNLCPLGVDDLDPTLWPQIHNISGQMLTLVNKLMIRVEVEHLRGEFAQSVFTNKLTPETEATIKKIEHRLTIDTENPEAAYLLGELDGAIKESLVLCYKLVGNFLDPKPPRKRKYIGKATQAATTA